MEVEKKLELGKSFSAPTIIALHSKPQSIITGDIREDLLVEIEREQLTIIEKTTQSDANHGFVYFDLGNIKQKTEETGVHLIGKIPIMRPPEDYALVIPEELEYCMNWMEQFMLTHKLVRKAEMGKRRKIRELARDLFTLYGLCPRNYGLTDEASCLVIAMTQLIFVTDDIVEESELLARNQEHSFLASQYLTEIMNGNFELKPDDDMFPALVPSAKAARYIMKELDPILPNWKTDGQSFVAAVKSTYSGLLCLQIAQHHTKRVQAGTFDPEDYRDMSEETFKFLRRSDAAGRATIEIGLLALGIEIPQEIRENLFFQRFMEVVELLIACQNDLLGLGKDVERNEWNLVLFKVQNSKLSLEQAFKEVLELVEQLVHDYNYLKARLTKFFKTHEMALKWFFEGVSAVIDTNGYLLLYTTRHGDLKKAFLNVDLSSQPKELHKLHIS